MIMCGNYPYMGNVCTTRSILSNFVSVFTGVYSVFPWLLTQSVTAVTSSSHFFLKWMLPRTPSQENVYRVIFNLCSFSKGGGGGVWADNSTMCGSPTSIFEPILRQSENLYEYYAIGFHPNPVLFISHYLK
jgi:hypothetical protein